MDSAEERAHAYLSSLSIGTVEYEPDGNIPPDFLVGGCIAIEVRRLNQNVVDSSGRIEGVEQAHFAMARWLYNELPKLGLSMGRESWCVSAKWRRPLPDYRILRLEIRRALEKFMLSPVPQPASIRVHPNFELQLAPAGRVYEGFFCLATVADADRGGFVVAEAVRNVHLCLSDKAEKIEQHRSRYREWWLVLFDTLHLGMSFEDWSEVRTRVQDTTHVWSKVIVLSAEFPGTPMIL